MITLLGQVLSQKNSKQIAYNRATGKPFVMSSQRVKDWQEAAAWQLKTCKEKYLGPVELEIKIYNKDRRARDLDNQIATICDALVKAKIIEDDSCKVVQKVSAEFCGIDKNNPRAEIIITHLNNLEHPK